VPEDRIETPPPRSLSRQEEEAEPETQTEMARDDRYYSERLEEEEAEPRIYNYRRRRAERDGRYDDEDAEFYGERDDDHERYDPYYDEEAEEDYDDDRAYYPLRPRWRRY
jgi:hypothetical protein